MGFLDGLLRSVKREVESDITRKAANTVVNGVANAFNNNTSTTAQTSNINPGAVQAPSNERYQGFVIPNNSSNGGYQPSNPTFENGQVIIDGIDYSQGHNCDRNHFRNILMESFPGMTLSEDVPVRDFIQGANGAYQSVSFLLSEGGAPKVAIQLRSPHMSTKVGTQRLLKQHGIGYISLWTDYKNQKEYIEKRVRDCLWN